MIINNLFHLLLGISRGGASASCDPIALFTFFTLTHPFHNRQSPNLNFLKSPEFLYPLGLSSMFLKKALVDTDTLGAHYRRGVSCHGCVFRIRQQRHLGISCPRGEPLWEFC